MIKLLTCPVCKQTLVGVSEPQPDCSTIDLPGTAGRPVAGAEKLRPQLASSAPFCSERCRKIDLFRWFDGRYAIVEALTEEQLEAVEHGASDPSELPDGEF